MFIEPIQRPRHPFVGLLFWFGMAALVGCRNAEYVPGSGHFLQVSLFESDADSVGSVAFTKTNQSIQSSGIEMECRFQDGSILRGPFQGFGTIVCYLPFPNDPSNPQVITTQTFTEADILALPGAPRSRRKATSGTYHISKPHPGYQWGCKATFRTTMLPTQFRFVQKGISSEWVTINRVAQ